MVAAKTTSDASEAHPFPPDPNSSQSTVNTVAREITEAGGEAYAVAVDVRFTGSVTSVVDETVRHFGALDVLVYNSGAIWSVGAAKPTLPRCSECSCEMPSTGGHQWRTHQ